MEREEAGTVFQGTAFGPQTRHACSEKEGDEGRKGAGTAFMVYCVRAADSPSRART